MDTESAYNAALDYLYSFVDYSLKHASELAKADFDLGRMRALMAMLGNPQDTYPVIHVAGTKGKGSLCVFCASALHAAGYRTGLFTSPHLRDFCERIQVDGQPIPPADLAALVEAIKPHVAEIPFITTFELTTALGFLYFARRNVDVAVIEVGLGGRLDATNIITPKLSVITSLSYDHTLVLGNTLAQIAGEKAGIIKEGVPVVSAPQVEAALRVLVETSLERHASLTLVGRDVLYEPVARSLEGQSLRVWAPQTNAAHQEGVNSLTLQIPLLGLHQVVNAATAYAALRKVGMAGLKVSDESIQKGFAEVNWPGRFEILRREPPVIVDAAHNRASASMLRQTVDEYFPGRPVILVIGTLEDKDLEGMMAELAPRARQVIATYGDHPRSLPVEKVVESAKRIGVPIESATPVAAALERALALAGEDALILLTGGVFYAGEALAAWDNLSKV